MCAEDNGHCMFNCFEESDLIPDDHTCPHKFKCCKPPDLFCPTSVGKCVKKSDCPNNGIREFKCKTKGEICCSKNAKLRKGSEQIIHNPADIIYCDDIRGQCRERCKAKEAVYPVASCKNHLHSCCIDGNSLY